jgi:tripartite ATP-independent transporter DctM subunit
MIGMTVTLLLTLALGIPIFVALGLAGWVGLGQAPSSVLAEQMVSTLDSFPLVAVPLFLLMGHLMTYSGIASTIVSFANAMLGRFRGGLALSNIGAGVFFAGISGSAVADTTALGAILVPAMKKEGYSGGFAGAVTAASGALGPIIPPSILMVLYGVQSGTSIEGLFVTGVVPGLATAVVLAVIARLIAGRRRYPTHPPIGLQETSRRFVRALPALCLPSIIVVGIIGGVFTVTESAAVAVLYALILACASRQCGMRDFWRLLHQSGMETAGVLIVIAASAFLAWTLTRSQVPQMLVDFMQRNVANPLLMLLTVNALLLVVGMFFAPAAGLIIVTPLLAPLARAYGIDPLQLGVMIVFNLNLGLLTPPVGISLMITARIAKTSYGEQVREAMPFFAASLVVLGILTYWPAFSLALPRVLGY